ncbi:MAG: hypothetical protein QNK37_25105 [Acidobacteriota bacterium]|nr:hypothetical protein [Acidobacteriota bacterium]
MPDPDKELKDLRERVEKLEKESEDNKLKRHKEIHKENQRIVAAYVYVLRDYLTRVCECDKKIKKGNNRIRRQAPSESGYQKVVDGVTKEEETRQELIKVMDVLISQPPPLKTGDDAT